MAALRGLQQLAPVPAGVQEESELREFMRSSIAKEWGPEDDAVERAYKRLGLLPEALNTQQMLVEFYTSQLAGYYDPQTKRFFLKADESASGAPEDFAIAHEFAHALQDQHFDLQKLLKAFERNEDRSLATSALVEGDAMLAGIDHLALRAGAPLSASSPFSRLLIRAVLGQVASDSSAMADPEQTDELPAVLARQVLFPYTEGTLFASRVRAEFGERGIDQVFADPPQSTEQVLYPERYLDRRDVPAAIELAAPPAGWSALADQTLGMLTLQVLLEENLGKRAIGAAQGWDGDRYALWRTPEGGEALVWLSAWDSEPQARRFEGRARELLAERGAAGAVLRRGDLVAYVDGGAEPSALAEHLLQSRVERAADDQRPLDFWTRALRWPLFAGQLDRVYEVRALGGSLFAARVHPGGRQLELLGGLLARSERSPDRESFSALGGLLWRGSDTRHGYSASSVPALLSYHERRSLPAPAQVGTAASVLAPVPDSAPQSELRTVLRMGWLPPLPPLLTLRSAPARRELALLGGLAMTVTWGEGTKRGERLALGFFRVPFL